MRLPAGIALGLVLVGTAFFVLRSPTSRPPGVVHDERTAPLTEPTLAETLESLEREIELRPDDADLHFRRSNALRTLGRADDADAAYMRYIELRPLGDFGYF